MNPAIRKPFKPVVPLLLALQFWKGDQGQAEDLVNLICDLEQTDRADAEFALCPRRGSDMELVADMARKLKRKFAVVHVWEHKGFAEGWLPGSCELWVHTMMAASQAKRANQSTAHGMLTFEPDNVPLCVDWITKLRVGWNAAVADGARCMGTLCPKPIEHINGNMVIEIGLHNEITKLRYPGAATGWDIEFAPIFTQIGQGTNLIAQRYAQPVLTLEDLQQDAESGAVLTHGVKDKNLHKIGREFLFSSNVRE